ncbi:hypothetical protein COS93_02535 [bacterium (Candidatus Gribaldobacteria) CG07_land_8_20_14_0_80_33_18]|uniref:Uncharacterized protein n=1 Tax=bacterium (Candidatus Gribaldobacteria) CG07_land_8_20_14_0_80_33_18 TaxID=2014272 RepID=A0A2M6Z254_9BACT|nr:MAG: hypothetical protein COU04_01505 [bacterium (Candidatus Gribaldobacteria) CG10_big_fil_rev_8_21_14_0_10_33_41]PIU46432.1 MAG: hypothetical protein COS93_02535 [bacterium (Candidatus Gribaldobacteria) CG07_land_8_20_14_0_80_33_18]PJA00912.1 MAG: hypothetical protein COX75_01385 [bacterium (Candidatus Gribaldobacteria) CG_4_10_14_0_2_um_filter_33_15]PJB08197.1 MAG: hypothetical protein CO122_02395 [bacterium (Candidatus Gribaldobacteria) CG_4_9_14_3_um_filter_33_9]
MIGPGLKKEIKILKFVLPTIKISLILIFIVLVVFSLKFLYKPLKEIFIEKPVLETFSSFKIEKFKQFAPRLGIQLSE